MKLIVSSGIVAGFLAIPASAATLTFDGFSLDPLTTNTYSEAGLTIDTTATSASSFYIADRLKFSDDGDPGSVDQIELSTRTLFDLVSLEITHSDLGDAILFEAFRNALLVSEVTIDANNFGTLQFSDFMDLTSVRITVSGEFTDVSIDNLNYVSTIAAVPVPASGLFYVSAAMLIGILRRRRHS